MDINGKFVEIDGKSMGNRWEVMLRQRGNGLHRGA